MKQKKERQWDLALEGDAQNITAYELFPDLYIDSFVVGDHIP